MRKMTAFYDMGMDFLTFIEGIRRATCFESIIEAKMVVGIWVLEHLIVESKGMMWGV